MIKRKEAAELLGITTETVRFYENRNLLPELPREANGYRSYKREHLVRLSFIIQAKNFGFTLNEIKDLVDSGIADFVTRDEDMDFNTVETELTNRLNQKITSIIDEIERLTIMKSRLVEYRDKKMYKNLKEYNFCKIKKAVDSVV